uniref:Uncharacterized protein n=1 Tax=Solanum tuberosum TaxID=4113 RepID=M1A3F0_SOLTU
MGKSFSHQACPLSSPIPTHLLALQPPKGTFDNIERYHTRFFWSGKEEGDKHHWMA